MTRRRGERGQAVTEYVMIAGLLTAAIIIVNRYVLVMFSWMVVLVMRTISVFISSDPGH
jgi:hypothetical protein